MQEPTDDQLDGLFRKSAEEFNAPFDPAAWEALRSRLDTHDRLTIGEHLLRWGLPVLLLLFLTGGSWNAHRQRAVSGQLIGRDVAVRQLTPANANPTPNGSSRPRQQRINTDKDQRTQKEVVLNGPAATAVARSGGPKQPMPTADATVRNTDESTDKTVVSPTITNRNGSATPRPTNAELHPNEATTPARSAYWVKPARSSATNRVSTVSAPKRIRVGTSQQKELHRLSKKYTSTGAAAIFSATNNAIKPAKSFTKRRATPDNNTRKLTRESSSGVGSLPLSDALSAHRFSVGASDKTGGQLILTRQRFVHLCALQ